jgi:hypothetical protein
MTAPRPAAPGAGSPPLTTADLEIVLARHVNGVWSLRKLLALCLGWRAVPGSAGEPPARPRRRHHGAAAMSAAPAATIQPELAVRLLAVARAIDNALVAADALRAALKPGHPPFDAPLAEGVRRYGNGPVFGLWAELRALNELSLAWTGKGFPIAEAPMADEPDEAPGLTTELARGQPEPEPEAVTGL